jgi:hypothetical protein
MAYNRSSQVEPALISNKPWNFKMKKIAVFFRDHQEI